MIEKDKPEIICTKVAKRYNKLDLDSYKNRKVEYDLSILTAASLEIARGYKIYKVNKPTKKGTLVKFKKIEKGEDYSKIFEEIKSLLTRTFEEG